MPLVLFSVITSFGRRTSLNRFSDCSAHCGSVCSKSHPGAISASTLSRCRDPATPAKTFQHQIKSPPFRSIGQKGLRNSERTGKSNPGYVHFRLQTEFQSIRVRTASAACQSVKPSAHCIRVTIARNRGAFTASSLMKPEHRIRSAMSKGAYYSKTSTASPTCTIPSPSESRYCPKSTFFSKVR